jgi:peptidoglycan/LPS O-acetylase OafA/YrhL
MVFRGERQIHVQPAPDKRVTHPLHQDKCIRTNSQRAGPAQDAASGGTRRPPATYAPLIVANNVPVRTMGKAGTANDNRIVKIEYPNLDFLRSLAVLLVVACHVGMFYVNMADIIAPLGALGVELFFVHTSLVLMQSLERQEREGSKHLFRTFITRRFFRIYPLATLVTIAVLSLHIPQGGMQVGHVTAIYPSISYVVYNLTLTQGFFILAPSIVAPLWSLSFEVEMYLFLPFLYRLLRGQRYAAPILYVGVLGVSALIVHYYPYESGYSFLRLFRVAPCFMPGLVAFWLSKKVAPRLPAYAWCLLLLALPGLVIWVPAGWFPWLWRAPIIVGFAIPWFKQLTLPALNAISRIIARYSYGVYLVHYFCIWAGLEKLGHGHPVLGPIIFCVLVTALPVALYHAVEKPFITIGKRLSSTDLKARTAGAVPITQQA